MRLRYPQVGLACFAALLGGNAWAEEPATLPDIIVTAQKISQPLEEVAASVSAVDGDLIRDSTAASFADLQDYIANATIAISVSAGQFAVRGFGTQDSNAGFDPSVGTVVDGLYYGRSNFLSAFFHDLQRIEIVRGPQGTLFGRNSTAGLLNVVTEAPGQDVEIRADALVEDNGDISYRPVLALPLTDDLAMRLSGNYETAREGLLYNTFLDRPERNPTQYTTRLRLRYVGEDDWHTDLIGVVSRQEQNFNLFRFTHLTDDMRTLVQSYDPLANSDLQSLTNSANLPALEKGEIRSLSASFSSALPVLGRSTRFAAIAGVAESRMVQRDLDADFSPVPFVHDVLREPARFRQQSLELRLSGEAPHLLGLGYGLSFVAGVYYYDATFRTSDLFEVEDLGAAFAYLTAAQTGGDDPVPGAGAFGRIGGLLGGPLGQALDLLNPLTGPFIGERQSAEVALSQRAR
ncbi:MAG TPA: TonB-dependent receptor plug domain-containing protein, partial [Solimonas sp.]|nr:TonB-dependent receptor plug domain-containing protein [Solimonas sp.]